MGICGELMEKPSLQPDPLTAEEAAKPAQFKVGMAQKCLEARYRFEI